MNEDEVQAPWGWKRIPTKRWIFLPDAKYVPKTFDEWWDEQTADRDRDVKQR